MSTFIAASTEIEMAPAGYTVRRGRQVIDGVFVVAAIAVLTLLITTAGSGIDEDLWWHLRTGDWIRAHGSVPRLDPFSSYSMGKPWIAYSWLFDLALSLLYSWGGLHAILALTALIAASWPALLTGLLSHWIPLRRAAILASAAYLAICPLVSPRPWIFTILFFLLELYCLYNARESDRPAWLIPIIPVFVLWANMHVQFVYGLAILTAFALDHSLPEKLRLRLSAEPRPKLSAIYIWALLAVCALVTLLNPYGWRIYQVVQQYASQSTPLILIQEMQSMQFRCVSDWFVLSLVLCASFAIGYARRKNLLLILLLVVSSIAGFRSARDRWFSAVVSVVAAASSLPAVAKVEQRRFRRTLALAIPTSLFLVCLIVANNKTWSETAIRKRVAERFPEQASSFVRTRNLPGPLFNTYDWGGFLIWDLPELPVSIDGRANLYGTYLLNAAVNMSGGNRWAKDRTFQKANTIILEQNSALASILRVDQDYRLVYEDKIAAIFQPVTSQLSQK